MSFIHLKDIVKGPRALTLLTENILIRNLYLYVYEKFVYRNISGCEDFRRVALVVLHVKLQDYAWHGCSKSVINCSEEEKYKTTGVVIDWLYQVDQRNQNDDSKNKIITFIENQCYMKK